MGDGQDSTYQLHRVRKSIENQILSMILHLIFENETYLNNNNHSKFEIRTRVNIRLNHIIYVRLWNLRL